MSYVGLSFSSNFTIEFAISLKKSFLIYLSSLLKLGIPACKLAFYSY